MKIVSALLGLSVCVLAVYGQGNLVNLDAKNQADFIIIVDGIDKMNSKMFTQVEAFGEFEGMAEFLGEVKNSTGKSMSGYPDQQKYMMKDSNVAIISIINGKVQMKMLEAKNRPMKVRDAIKAAMDMFGTSNRKKFLILIGAHDSLMLSAELRTFDRALQAKDVITLVMVPHYQEDIDFEALEKMAEEAVANTTTTA